MKDISEGLSHYNYIGSRKVKALFKGEPFEIDIKNINFSGQKRGCSGFIINTKTEQICYISTEPFFDGKEGSGLWRDKNKAILMRTAKSTKDYVGGTNHYIPMSGIVSMAHELTECDFDTWLEQQPEGTCVQGGGID